MAIRIENQHFLLLLGEDCIPRSLLHKTSGEECLVPQKTLSLFSVTQPRPFNNEIKLAYPNKQTTYQANRVRREGDKLIVGFEIIPYEAIITLKETDDYIAFRLEAFQLHPGDYCEFLGAYLNGGPPPIDSFRLLQLPVADRTHFGQWLNVVWDEEIAVNVLATCPEAIIDSEKRDDCRVLTADALSTVQLQGTEAALITAATDKLLNAIDTLEQDYGLPRGVQSRRDPRLLVSSYSAAGINPETVDYHIEKCKQCGYGMMTIYMEHIYNTAGYTRCGDYDYRDTYPQGPESLHLVLQKLKTAGITPGFHFLHPHIGIHSRYLTPVADHRLHLTRHFTLSRPLDTEQDTVYVEQNPAGSPMGDGFRILQFGGELIAYTGFTAQRPYRFTGCSRGHLDTYVIAHPLGQIGGILDVSEFGAKSVYLDQDTDLQDEVADKLAQAYAQGFEYLYFDGSEGTNAPFAYHVANAQYRVWQKLKPAPLYCEGAAKTHFSWHFLTGGNAFDAFPPSRFKEMIRRHPAAEAPRMQEDFTRLNFGWWGFYPELQPDHWEFGSSQAAAWDCPATIQGQPAQMSRVPRLDDLLEVLRRWEDVRVRQLLTPEQKKMLRENPEQEHILLINEEKVYELVPYRQLQTADERLQAFLFTRRDRRWVVFWHTQGEGRITLPIADVQVRDELWEAPLPKGEIPVSHRRYLSTGLSEEEVEAVFRNIRLA